jgi:hypothetical protein
MPIRTTWTVVVEERVAATATIVLALAALPHAVAVIAVVIRSPLVPR